MTGAQNRGPPSVFSNETPYRNFERFLTTSGLSMMYYAFSNRMVLYIIWNLAGWYSKLFNMNKRCIRKDDFSKWLKVCRNTKKMFFTIDYVSIIKKRRKKRLGLWKCRCATHSEVWMWRMHQCTFIEDSQLHNIRLLS